MNNNAIRATLYTAIAALAACSGWLADAPASPTWREWFALGLGASVAGLTSLRAYLDGSAERARQAVAISPDGWHTAPPSKLPLVLALALPLLATTACQHTPEAQAYLTLANTKTVVLEAMDVYAVQVAVCQVDPATEAKIDRAYLQWSAAFEAAVELARFDYASATPDTVKRLALQLVNLIDDL
jgi:hypothetical protein